MSTSELPITGVDLSCPICSKPLSMREIEKGYSLLCKTCYAKDPLVRGDSPPPEVPEVKPPVKLKGLK